MYILEMFQSTSDGYYYGPSSQIGQHLTYYDMRYCNSCTQNTFPTIALANLHYGYPDFLYTLKKTINPEPTYFMDTLKIFEPYQLTNCSGNGIQIGNIVQNSCLCQQNKYSWSPNININDTSLAQPTVYPNDTTTYTVTVIDGCNNSITSSVKINTLKTPITFLSDTLW